jgi:hypothetical protein
LWDIKRQEEYAGRLPTAMRGGGTDPMGRIACSAFGTVDAIKEKLSRFSS